MSFVDPLLDLVVVYGEHGWDKLALIGLIGLMCPIERMQLTLAAETNLRTWKYQHKKMIDYHRLQLDLRIDFEVSRVVVLCRQMRTVHHYQEMRMIGDFEAVAVHDLCCQLLGEDASARICL